MLQPLEPALSRYRAPATPAGQSPPIVVEPLPLLGTGTVHVVREDRLPGGTKQRGALPYLSGSMNEGIGEFVYASPFAGFAQIALARSARALGARCTLFCERDRTVGGMLPHAFTREALEAGARVFLAPDLDEASRRAGEYAAECRETRVELPLGFDCPGFRDALVEAITPEWERLKSGLGGPPRRLWLSVGSGTLANVFHEILQGATRIIGVSVGVLPHSDPRIERLRRLGIDLRICPERFFERARIAAPVPSNVHYDAKLWRLIAEDGQDGDVWWNVAR